jgi:predicted transcriptional regulator
MKANLERTTVKDISYLINSSCLRANSGISLEKLADMLCSSDRYKVYLEDAAGKLTGVIQAKQIAMKILELSLQKSDEEEMLPAIAYVLNFHHGSDLAEAPVCVQAATPLKQVLELMHRNSIREIPVVDKDGRLVGTLEAKHILSHYLQAKAQTAL